MSLSGDLNLPVSLHVGQASLKEKHDDSNCPYLALLDQASEDEAYAIHMEEVQQKALEEAR